MSRAALAIEPRGLKREVAAAYVGVSAAKFDDMVSDGRMPKPKCIDRRRVWDRVELDRAFEALPDTEGGKSDWDDVA